MKLLKCYIENFGVLQNFKYDFYDGLNTIKENNGFGKTTFATFIKSMFYGLDISNKTEKSDRVKYKPWQGGNFGGYIEFELDNKKYRIERFFGPKSSDDSFKLYDLSTNLESYDFSKNIGEEIFKINKEAYERSTYIPQGQIQINMEDSLSAKLGNVLENENDVQTSDEAIKKIDETMKIYKKTGSRGVLNQKKDKLNELKRNLENCKIDEDNLNLRKEKMKEIKQKIKEEQELKIQKQELLAKKIENGRKQAKLEVYNNILNKLNENKKEYYELSNVFKDYIPENSNINEMVYKSVELGENIDNAILQFPKVQEYDIEIQKKENDLKNMKQQFEKFSSEKNKKNKNAKIILCSGILLFLICLVLIIFSINQIINIGCGISGFILLLFGIIKLNNKKIDIEIQNIEKTIKDIEKDIKDLNVEKNKIVQEMDDILRDFSKTSNDKIVLLSDLKIKVIQFINVLKELDKNQKLKNDYEKNNDINNLKNKEDLGNINEIELNNDIKMISIELDKLIDEKNQFKNQIEILENKIDENEYLETDIQNLQEEINEIEKKYSILKQTKELLESAKENFASSYLKEMINGYTEILNMINDKNLETNVDINLDVKIEVNGSKKDVKYFSTGYKDLIYICMRLSLINALFKEEKPFIILDDPFVNLDEEKTAKALNLLKKLSDKYQIIYFICNSSRKGVEKN